MEVYCLNVIHIFFFRISSMAHITDDVPGRHGVALRKALRIRIILAQVPAQNFHISGFHSHHRRPDLAHHIMAQVGPFIAIASGGSEIIIIGIGKSLGNGRIGLQPIFPFPHRISGFILFLKQEFAHHTAQHGVIGLIKIVIVIQVTGDFFHRGFSVPDFFRNGIHILQRLPTEFTAVFGRGTGQEGYPVYMEILTVGFHIRIISLTEGFIGNIKIHPLNIILLRFFSRLFFRFFNDNGTRGYRGRGFPCLSDGKKKGEKHQFNHNCIF